MMEVEGGTPESCAQLLRHECGHAVDHAYRFSSRRNWRAVFGSPNVEYEPERYRPRPYSRSFVRHLPNWYAQAHPDEDFAETFAVWLSTPEEEWRARYRGWKAAREARVRRRADARGAEQAAPRGARHGATPRRRLEAHVDARALLRSPTQAVGGGLPGLLRRRLAPHLRAEPHRARDRSRLHAPASRGHRRGRRAVDRAAQVRRRRPRAQAAPADAPALGLHAPRRRGRASARGGRVRRVARDQPPATRAASRGRCRTCASSSSSTCTVPWPRSRRSACSRCAPKRPSRPKPTCSRACASSSTTSRRWPCSTT